MKNEKSRRRDRSCGWAWRKRSILFGKRDPNNPAKEQFDNELELLQAESIIKTNAFISPEETP